MRYLSTFLVGSLFVVACKSEGKKPTAEPAPPAKPVETTAKPTAPEPAAPDPTEVELTAAERAKMDRDPADERLKEELVKEAHAESMKDQQAKGIPAAEAALKAMIDGSFDYQTIDPTTALVHVDYTAKPPIERASCGPAPKELAALASAAKSKSLYCSQLPTKLVRCAVPLVAANDASSDFDELMFDFEIVMGDAVLRSFAKRHTSGTTEERTKMFAEHDAKIVKLGKTSCPDAHGP